MRRAGPVRAGRAAAAAALAAGALTAVAAWAVEGATVRELRSAIDADLLTQQREWRRSADGLALDDPAQVESAARRWIEEQRDHTPDQVQVVTVTGGRHVSNRPGPLADALARGAAAGPEPVTTAVREAGAVRVLAEPVVRQGRVVGVVRVADPLRPVSRATARLRRTFTLLGVLGAGLAAVSAAAASALVARLRDAVRRQREFASDVSHDLRTPLGVARVQLELLRDADDERERHRGVRLALAQVDRLDRLVTDLLTLAVARERSAPPVPPVCRVRVDDLLEDLRRELPLLGDRRFSVAGCPGSVPADPDQLDRVLRNLVTNAVRHTGPGGTVAVVARPRGDRLRVTVTDDGPGIPPHHVERVFERHERLPSPSGAGGTGLGLPIARALVEVHGGRLWAEPVPGGGGRFHVELPGYRP